ncbi:MAG: cellulase family glycosylhydrolase [Bacteroidales bacterium]|nr:cellulase family glycosylhydrolase [Bacteroidales bacterium]
MKRLLCCIGVLFVFASLLCAAPCKKVSKKAEGKPVPAQRWSEEKANAWYESQDWPVGCVFVPSNTGTPVDMWAADTFDEELIDRELGMAESLGFNAIRLFMCDIVWQNDRDGYMERLEKYLSLSDKHGIKILLTFFTNGGKIKNPYMDPRPQPVPGIHNSIWMSSPGRDVVNNPDKWPVMEEYLKCVMTKYKDDPRVLAWCLYNEPENTKTFNTLPFLESVYRWAREVNPSQPLTSPIWSLPGGGNCNMPIQAFVLSNSDVISFHCYDNSEVCGRYVRLLKQFNRPIFCSEWMARTKGSDYFTILPIFKRNKVASFSYGLVNSKQQCHYPWNPKDKDGKDIPYEEEPPVWFHDLFRTDGTPWNPDEIIFIRSLTGK